VENAAKPRAPNIPAFTPAATEQIINSSQWQWKIHLLHTTHAARHCLNGQTRQQTHWPNVKLW